MNICSLYLHLKLKKYKVWHYLETETAVAPARGWAVVADMAATTAAVLASVVIAFAPNAGTSNLINKV
jgi:hypothetical protein